MNGIFGQASGVVGVRVATGNREHALRHQLSQGMIDLAGLSSLWQTGGELVQQSQAVIGSLQQRSATIGTPFSLIKLGHDRLGENIREQRTLCCAIVRQEEASGCAPNCDSTPCL